MVQKEIVVAKVTWVSAMKGLKVIKVTRGNVVKRATLQFKRVLVVANNILARRENVA